MIKIKNLHVSVEGKEILKGVDLVVRPGKVQVLMGPNGSGKSTLAYALMGHPRYVVARAKSKEQRAKSKKGRLVMMLDGKSLIGKTPDERARMGLFLAFQNPVGVEGVSVQNFLKSAYEAVWCVGCREGEVMEECPRMSVLEFRKMLQKKAQVLGINPDLLKRPINDGFSGGEKKKIEVLQMSVLKPKYAILDETDSGLDIDALRLVARGIKKIMKENTKMGVILITHYQRIFRFIKPDFVQVMVKGRFVESGGKELVRKLEKEGYKKWLNFDLRKR